MLNVNLLEGNTEDDGAGRLLHVGGGDVDFIAQIKVEQHTSSPGVVVIAQHSRAAVGDKQNLWDPLSTLIQIYVDCFPWIKVGIEREVDSPSSTEAGHKLASVDINTRRISLKTRLAGVEQFVVRDDGLR